MIFRPSAKRPVAYLKSTLVRRISFNEAVLAQSMYCFWTPFVNNKIYSMEFNPFKTETQEMNDNFNSNESCQESEIIEETIILPELNVENFNPFNKQTSFIPSFATKGTSYDSEEKQILAVENFSERDSTSKSTPNHYIRPDVTKLNFKIFFLQTK